MEKLIIELEKLRYKMLEVLMKALMTIIVIATLMIFDVDLTTILIVGSICVTIIVVAKIIFGGKAK